MQAESFIDYMEKVWDIELGWSVYDRDHDARRAVWDHGAVGMTRQGKMFYYLFPDKSSVRIAEDGSMVELSQRKVRQIPKLGG